jgi:hypothetical protein
MSSYVIVLTILFSGYPSLTHTYVQQAVTKNACPEELVLRHVYPVTMRVQHLSVILRDTMCDFSQQNGGNIEIQWNGIGYNGM